MAYEELKQRQSVMWGMGPYQRVTETISDIHELVVERLDPQPGERWLDLACGTGAVAERAAARGAAVTGVDLAPVLIETAAERATQRGLEIDYRVGDCERLDLQDASFDIVSSTCGIMFAPDHEATARELGRVIAARRAARPRELDADRRPRADVQDDGAVPAGTAAEQSLRLGRRGARRGAAGRVVRARALRARLDPADALGEAYWDLFSTSYGPTKVLADSLGERRGELQRTWVEFFESNYAEGGEIVHTREYLLVLGRRRS